MANINETIKQVEKLNPELAAELKQYVKTHSYGLVYEQNLPDAIRIYSKKPAKGDTVNILPHRGTKESAESRVAWVVNSLHGDEALLKRSVEEKKVDVKDLAVLVSYKDVVYPGLKEIDRIENGGPDNPFHVVINSENYHALEALGYAYNGMVDCIYIDPPYNTGAKDWKYNNDYVDGSDQYKHSKWLSFIERRLRIAKQLLNPKNSALIVTIDEKEYSRLGVLLEQIFPDANIQMVSITINRKGAKRERLFARSDEYAYIVLFGDAQVVLQPENSAEKEVRWFYLRRTDYASRRGTTKGGTKQFYPIYVDTSTQKIATIGAPIAPNVPIDEVQQIPGCVPVFPVRDDGVEMNWGVTGESLQELIKEGLVRISPGTEKQPFIFKYLSTKYKEKVESGRWAVRGTRTDGSKIVVETGGKVPRVTTVWDKKSYDAGQYGTTLLNEMIGAGRFNFPKSVFAVEDTLRYFVGDNKDALIVDFFGGSGTTLHATGLLNYEDNGHRRCICITNNEVSDSEAKEMTKQGLRPGDEQWENRGIAKYVTWPRVKAAISGQDVNGKPINGDYGVYHDSFELVKNEELTSNRTASTKVYRKVQKQAYNPKLAKLDKKNGLMENAVFMELTYESPWPIRLDRAFNAIAPILWLHAGCQGPVINKISSPYALTDYYGVLFDYGYAGEFFDKVRSTSSLRVVFIVTDDQRRYTDAVKELPEVEVKRLYESYLRTFEIYGEGRFD